MHYDVAVIGGGAAGLVAAIAAKRGGAQVVILEKNQKIGRKILATGNGRCNLGNEDLSLSHFVSGDLPLATKVLEHFNKEASLRFFHDLGLEFASEEGRIYPRSKQALAVLEVLRHELEHLGVHIELEASVQSIEPSKSGFNIAYGTDKTLFATKIILATGGMAGPQLGCTGDGYTIAQKLGHKVIDPAPALVGLRLKSPHLKTLSGLRLEAKVAITELELAETGEVIFTDYGLSGIPVFDLTRAIGGKKGLTLNVFLTPDISSEHALAELLVKRFGALAHKTLSEALIGFLPRQLVNPVLKEVGLNPEQAVGKTNKTGVTRLAEILWCWQFPIVGLNTWEQAQTTYGGIPLRDVNPATLESILVKSLFFAGEILDVHGRCGGYNLHWAWASGFVAGRSAAADSSLP